MQLEIAVAAPLLSPRRLNCLESKVLFQLIHRISFSFFSEPVKFNQKLSIIIIIFSILPCMFDFLATEVSTAPTAVAVFPKRKKVTVPSSGGPFSLPYLWGLQLFAGSSASWFSRILRSHSITRY
jgi:hypothetical protein